MRQRPLRLGRGGNGTRSRSRTVRLRARPTSQPVRQRLPLEILHDEEVGAGFVADIIEGADVRMIERRDRPCFTVEPLAERRVQGGGIGDHLDRDDAIEAGVAGAVDLAHAAGADRRLNLVRSEPTARWFHWISLFRRVRDSSADGWRKIHSMSEGFRSHPDPSQWDDYVDFESTSWPKKERRRYWIIPSICFNCESACGILAYVDKNTLDVRKIEGNPMHPGSRGRTCAKGVVTPNQLEDPDRIMYPLRRKGERGEGLLGAGLVGRGARGHRRADPQGDRREPPPRADVPRRTSR